MPVDHVFFLGIDVSCNFFHAAIPGRKPRRFDTSRQGANALLDWVRQDCPISTIRAVMEHTGVYSWELQGHLQSAGFECSLMNPARTRHWADSEGRRSKTDSQDALAILSWAQYHRPAATILAPESQRRLDSLMRGREELVSLRVSVVNRLKAMSHVPEMYGELVGIWQEVEAKITDCEARVELLVSETLAQDEELSRAYAVVTGMCGFGPTTGSILCAMLYRVLDCSEKQLTALAGLAPRDWSSGGSSGKPRIDKKGIPRLRRVLYWVAIAAIRRDPAMRELWADMKSRGKPGKVVVMAVARRMLLKAQRALKEEFRNDSRANAA